MVDLHCHILPNVDDGAKSIEQSLEIAKEAEQNGFHTICCSPHYMIPNYTNTKENNKEVMGNLKRALLENHIDIQLKLSNEIYITEDIINLLENDIVSKIEDTDYILMELPMYQEIKFLDEILDNLENANIHIILAHPERYKFVQKNPNSLFDFVERGIVLQSNYGSLIGKYGPDAQKTILKLLKANMVNVLASDVHRDQSIYTYMEEINARLKKLVNPEYYKLLTEENPNRIIENREIEVLKCKKIKKFFF